MTKHALTRDKIPNYGTLAHPIGRQVDRAMTLGPGAKGRREMQVTGEAILGHV